MENKLGQLIDIPLDVLKPSNNYGNSKKTSTFNSKNYLNVSLDSSKGEKTKTLKIRLLPMDVETGNPFQRVFIHTIKVPEKVDKRGKKAYACLERTEGIDHDEYGHTCPICKLNKEAKEKLKDPKLGDAEKKQWEEIRKATEPREAYIVRCIERGKEDEGPKFWRIKTRIDHTDPYNAIIKLATMRMEEGEEVGVNQNILSVYDGKDLSITINEGTAAPIVTDASLSTPITRDEALLEKWYYDEKKWYDVFPIKSCEYLELVYMGKVPFFDKKLGKWVSNEKFTAEKEEKEKDIKKDIEKAENKYKGNTDRSASVMGGHDILDEFTPDEDDMPY